jgi:tetratricopeptide (TPR) repeat protein
MKYIFIFLLFCCNQLQAANLDSALGVYLKEIADTATSGVYEQSGLLFFVAEQACTKKKKHSGTKESRLARKKIVELIHQEFVSRSAILTRAQISYTGELGDAIYQQALQSIKQESAQLLTRSKLLIDKEEAPCVQRVVTVMVSADFAIKSPVSTVEIDQELMLSQVIEHAVAEDEFRLLAALFNTSKSPELAAVFQLNDNIDIENKWPIYHTVVNLDTATKESLWPEIKACDYFSDEFNYKQNKLTGMANLSRCGIAINDPIFQWQKLASQDLSAPTVLAILENDFTGALSMVLKSGGAVKFAPVPTVYRNMSQQAYAKAEKLFDAGIEAKKIINLLTNAITTNPNNHQTWIMLGTMMRAKKLPTIAMHFYFQALLQKPKNTDIWLHIAKSLAQLGHKEKSSAIAELLLKFQQAFSVSNWAQQQAQQLLTK